MSKKLYLKSPLRLLFSIAFVLVLSIVFVLIFHDSASGSNIPEYATIIVSKGDTLWNIARTYNYDNIDIRNKIDEIKELNKISSNIQVGQELLIKIN